LTALLLAVWILLPFAILATGPNQDYRLIAPSLAALAVAAGCMAAAAGRLAFILAIGFAAVSAIPFVRITAGPTARTSAVAPASHAVDFNLEGNSQGYARRPWVEDRARPVADWVLRRSAEADLDRPAVIALLQTDPEMNPNTLSWWTFVRTGNRSAVVFTEAQSAGLDDAAFRAQFDGYDAVGIIRGLASPSSETDRLALLNQRLAGNRTSGEILKSFSGEVRSFPTGVAGQPIVMRWRG
jgi:hypothetical protein